MIRVLNVSSKSLKESRKAVVRAALQRWAANLDAITPEEGVSALVQPQAEGAVTHYRKTVKDSGGSIPRLAGELFLTGEIESLDSIGGELWSRTDMSAPPKSGADFGVKLLLRTIEGQLFRYRNPATFTGGEDDNDIFRESLKEGLPKLKTPKGGVATTESVSFIEALLRSI